MTKHKTALERAFEIARGGAGESVADIRRQLAREGFDQRQIEGKTLNWQLSGMLRQAREVKALDPCAV